MTRRGLLTLFRSLLTTLLEYDASVARLLLSKYGLLTLSLDTSALFLATTLSLDWLTG